MYREGNSGHTGNNTKANGLQNAHFSIISGAGLICAIKLRNPAIYSLEGSLDLYRNN